MRRTLHFEKESCLRSSCVINDIDSCIAVHMYRVAVISLMQCKKVVMKCILLHVMNEHSHDFKCVLVLQNCMGLIKDEPDSGSEACVTTLDDGTEEGNMEVKEVYIKAEETLDIKEENLEGITCPTIKAEPEVSVCACV